MSDKEFKYVINHTVQPAQYQPVVYTVRGDTIKKVSEDMEKLMKAYPPKDPLADKKKDSDTNQPEGESF